MNVEHGGFDCTAAVILGKKIAVWCDDGVAAVFPADLRVAGIKGIPAFRRHKKS
jgi:hypothetical protein